MKSKAGEETVVTGNLGANDDIVEVRQQLRDDDWFLVRKIRLVRSKVKEV